MDSQPKPAPEKPIQTPTQTPTKASDVVGRSLTREVTAEQINARGEGGAMRRMGEVREINVEARTVELAFSSTTPVRRWFGDEVLSHDAEAVVLDRLLDGGAVLVGHNWDDQVGVVQSARVDSDGVGRAVVRFGKSTRASEIFQDIVDGIRQHVSVGYRVITISEEIREGQPNLVTVTRWEPFEISVVPVPADPTVGIGRGMENPPEAGGAEARQTGGENAGAVAEPNDTGQRETQMNTIITRDAEGNLVRAKVDENDQIIEVIEVLERAGAAETAIVQRAQEQEAARVRELTELGREYGAPELANEMIAGRNGVSDMRERLLDHLHQRSTQDRQLSERSGIGLTDSETEQFSFMRAIRALANPSDRSAQEAAAFEFEVSDAAAEAQGRDAHGIMVPMDVLMRAPLNTGSGGATAADTGGNAIANPLLAQSFIQMLRNRTTMLRLATPMMGLVGNPDIPTQESGATGYWLTEDAEATEDLLSLGQRQLSPKTVAAYSELTRRMRQQASIDMEALVRSDLAQALATTIDLAGFYGSGTNDEPLGIANANGVNVVDFGGAASGGGSAMPTWAEVIQMESDISAANADVNSMAYVQNAKMRGHFKSTQKFSGTNGAPIWESDNTVNGYRGEVTNQIADGDVFHGDFSNVIVGMWGGLDLNIDDKTHSRRGRLRIVAMQDVDFVHRHPAGLCYGTDAT
ncbi:phage major capsid protein [Epibacterium sp. MM17-32]|uniref:phage major capsid protein n=1 Tax=Epibacterium sp. MM17-32 TaxID=2917734 RepID=UPI001EF5604A|nr:phage major capsid protein [Epibacterium sp. MM17-32]